MCQLFVLAAGKLQIYVFLVSKIVIIMSISQ